jgi:Transglycosylase SLT domain
VTVKIQMPDISAQVTGAINAASERTGVDRGYLWHQARVESGFDPSAKAKTSSASGLYQFTEQTWLRTLKAHGPKHGLSDWSNLIIQKPDGHHEVFGQNKHAVLALRTSADIAALMAAELAIENGTGLAKTTGRLPGATDLYMGHFLGVAGAGKFLNAVAHAPSTAAATLLPAAAQANRTVFYDKDGTQRTVKQVYDRFAEKFPQENMQQAATVDRLAIRQNSIPPLTTLPANTLYRDQVQLAYLLLADMGVA